MALIFVDCEAYGPAPGFGQLTEFGAVEYKSRQTFHGVIVRSEPSSDNPAIPHPLEEYNPGRAVAEMVAFAVWLKKIGKGRHIFVSDNPAFDYQWINYEFAKAGIENPFGHSARRIADFYAGLVGDFYQTQNWKRYRVTGHDHNPVNDAMGNVEAFAALLAGKR
jgi:DNA polymerase III epsilon subunit-like protein